MNNAKENSQRLTTTTAIPVPGEASGSIDYILKRLTESQQSPDEETTRSVLIDVLSFLNVYAGNEQTLPKLLDQLDLETWKLLRIHITSLADCLGINLNSVNKVDAAKAIRDIDTHIHLRNQSVEFSI